MKLYRSAAGSTVRLLGATAASWAANWTIDFRPRAEAIDVQGWRHVRFRPDTPRLAVWCAGETEPREIPLEEAPHGS